MMTKAKAGTWCDYCKAKWGKNRDGSWHDRAMTPAYITVVSELARSHNKTNSYCQRCLAEVSDWPTGQFTLSEQLIFAHSLDNPTLEALNV